MKRIVILLLVVAAISASLTAQRRWIARGAEAGELYISSMWYGNSVGGPFYDDLREAIFRTTDNGRKIEIMFDQDYFLPGEDPSFMKPLVVMADATPGVLYNHDQYYDDAGFPRTRLWISLDHGKTWELRDEPETQYRYYVSNIEGLIYRTGLGGTFESTDYAKTFKFVKDESLSITETGFEECEFFFISGFGFYHTYDCYENYVNLTLDNEVITPAPTDVFRGGLPGEIYISAGYFDDIFFSADTGYTFRKLITNGYGFMSDRKAGDFHLAGNIRIYPNPNSGSFYQRVCVSHYTDYGETMTGIWCHELKKQFPATHCLGILDLQAEVQGNNSVSLHWDIPETDVPISCFHLYRNDVLLKELQETAFLDESLPNGEYTYHVKALYADGCETLSYSVVTVTVETEGITEGDLSGVRVYPNPTDGMINVQCLMINVQNIEIFDLMGRNVSAKIARKWHEDGTKVEWKMDISHLPSGMYFLRIITENGIINRKIVKY